MITATITRRIPITQLRPGAVIDGHTIDSIELAADGATALCFPPGRTDGRRVRVPLGSLDGEVTVSAGNGDVLEACADLARSVAHETAPPTTGTPFSVELPSGWTFALHEDQPTSNGRAHKPADTAAHEIEEHA